MKDKKKVSWFEKYLTMEIGIEFKACLYFFGFLFFYCVHRLIFGETEASILHMAEMILTCYGVAYLQVYVFGNCDEADKLGVREYLGFFVCTLIYCLVSFFGNWYAKSISSTLIFGGYILFMYLCVFLIYRIKRKIDDKILNADLKQFQKEHKKVNDSDK